jgi:small subunit ribosomal protein S5
MAEEEKNTKNIQPKIQVLHKEETKKVQNPKVKVDFDERRKDALRRIDRSHRFSQRKKAFKKQEEFDVKLVSIRRVAKVNQGGKRLRISVMVVIGDRKGRVGVAIAKGKDVKDAETKAINKAKRTLVKIALKGQTIPHEIYQKFGAAKVFLKPAAPGTGVIAGGAVRAVAELAGIKDILSKVLGTKNNITNVYATFIAFKNLRLERS